jgi:transcriptional regulator with XRE-family HTH domain
METCVREISRQKPGQPWDRRAESSSPFADWLVAELRQRGWTRRDFAERIGVSPAAVTRWTRGQRSPSPSSLTTISAVLQVAPPVLIGARESERSPDGDQPCVSDAQDFAHWLRAQLDRQQQTPEWLAAHLGLDTLTVDLWLRGVLVPASRLFPFLARLLAVSPERVRQAAES